MSRTIAILGGTGPEGFGLAQRWAKAGEHVILGSRDAARAAHASKQLQAKIGANARIEGTDNATAASRGDIVVLAVPFPGHAALLKSLKNSWKTGTIVVDTTVPLAATVGGSPTRMLGLWQGSAAQQARELVPAEIPVVAALQNVGAELLASEEPVDCDAVVCSDDEKARQTVMELAAKIPGVRGLNGGKLENARIVESLTAFLIGMNIRYKVHSAGIRITGLPAS